MPSRQECIRILEEEGCEPAVIEHCFAVEALASKIGVLCDANLDLITAGALLHDVGRSITHDIWHLVRGVEVLERREIDERVIAIARKHLGAGLTLDDAKGLGFPDGDYMPSTIEEKIVTYSDNVVGDPLSPDRRKTGKEASWELMEKGLETAAERALALHNELCNYCDEDLDKI